jgi:16S rRNA C967 or C1407 C5-methylase (RsmB/RsmF family)/NOL1/NOP2/fmu family ribosome biogenesis protein
MFPEQFVERIKLQPYIDAERLLNALTTPSPVSIRINPQKWHLIPSGGKPVKWCGNGFYLDFRPSFTLDPLFHAGVYYPQEASGMFLTEIFNQLDLKSVELKILDLCGAPGGKSTHLSIIAGKDSFLLTNEVIRSRAVILRETLTRWGSPNTVVTQNDPSDFNRLEGFFDLILVDAPCSGEGMFRDPVAVNEWSVRNVSYCSERQKRILSDVWPALKKNGFLIYSTCTFSPEENEHNMQWFAGRTGAQTVRLDIKAFPEIKEISYKDVFGYGFYPGEVNGEGLFYSVLQKNDGKENKISWPKSLNYSKPGKDEIEMATKWSEFQAGDLIKSGGNLVAVPDIAIHNQLLQMKFRLMKEGTVILTLKNKKYIPSHELAFSSRLKENAFPSVELGYEKALQYLKRDIPVIKDLPPGWFIFKFRGVPLGFANNFGHRTNNYYPVEWRIRMDLPADGFSKIINWTI